MKICVIEGGWVIVGHLIQDDDVYTLTNGNVISSWGTTEGIGELAIKGPLKNTKLDKIPMVKFHKNKLIFTIETDDDKWQTK